MISLKGSRFIVSYDEQQYHVFTRKVGKDYQEVTNILTNEDKEELIDDLIYCIQDLVKGK